MKAKTKFLVNLFIIAVFTFSGKAQIFSGGIVGGVSTGAVRIENVGNGFANVLQGNNIYGFETGIFVKLKVFRFYVKPMALYNFSTGDVKNQNEANSSQTFNFTLHRLEAPVLFGIKIIGPLSIEAGPVYNYIIQSTNQSGDNSLNIAQSSGLGYRIGFALEIKRFLLNVSYGGVTINSDKLNGATFKEPYKIVFGLGIKFGKLNAKKEDNKTDSK